MSEEPSTDGPAPPSPVEPDGEAEAVGRLLEQIHDRYGYDFRDYAAASLRRRIARRVEAEGCGTIAGLGEKVLADPGCLERLIVALTVHVTALFRDPGFYLSFRHKVVPLLRTYPFLRVWLAGCTTNPTSAWVTQQARNLVWGAQNSVTADLQGDRAPGSTHRNGCMTQCIRTKRSAASRPSNRLGVMARPRSRPRLGHPRA